MSVSRLRGHGNGEHYEASRATRLAGARSGYRRGIRAPEKLLAAIALGRIGIGATALLSPRAIQLVLPQAAGTTDSCASVRMLAARDVALGVATLLALRLGGVTPVVFATVTADLADAAVVSCRRPALSARQWAPPVFGGLAGAAASLLCARALRSQPSV